MSKEISIEDDLSSSKTEDRVVLIDGTVRSLSGLNKDQLLALQWEQECAFARQILASSKGSADRTRITGRAYDTVTQIYAAANGQKDGPLLMGFQDRIQRFVLELLGRQQKRGLDVGFFEIGYGSGRLLHGICDAGFDFSGIEISSVMREQAVSQLGEENRPKLHLGDFLRCDAAMKDGPWSMVYWNDVFEHIPPDEISDWLKRIHQMLMPGGQLVSITPNWHVRPSDITRKFYRPRTESAGFHLKEYALREINALLLQAGFKNVATPLVVTHSRSYLCGRGMMGLKLLIEPCLEWLPFRLANLFCRGFGLNCTIATK